MILVDFSQVCLSVVFQQVDYTGKPRSNNMWTEMQDDHAEGLSMESIRRIFVYDLLRFRRKFKAEFGDFVFCVDSKNSWRSQVFPHYKIKRKKHRSRYDVDWDTIYKILDNICQELKEQFNYRVVQVESTEADDVIAVLSMYLCPTEKVLILSSDKDFKQLQKYENIFQYSPIKRDYIECENPQDFLVEHIVRGDPSDSIPNVLSPLTSFRDNIKQKPVFTKKLKQWIDEGTDLREMFGARYNQNEKLIDLEKIPSALQHRIINMFESVNCDKINSSRNKGSNDICDYFVKSGLGELIDCIGEF